jgi:hypothetical protein
MLSAGAPSLPATLFAQMRFDPELLILAILMVVLIVAGTVVVVRVRRWRTEELTPRSPEQQLRDYQAFVDRGELSPQEFEKIKAHMEQQRSQPPPNH